MIFFQTPLNSKMRIECLYNRFKPQTDIASIAVGRENVYWFSYISFDDIFISQVVPDERRRIRGAKRVENICHFVHALQYSRHSRGRSSRADRQFLLLRGQKSQSQTTGALRTNVRAPETTRAQNKFEHHRE